MHLTHSYRFCFYGKMMKNMNQLNGYLVNIMAFPWKIHRHHSSSQLHPLSIFLGLNWNQIIIILPWKAKDIIKILHKFMLTDLLSEMASTFDVMLSIKHEYYIIWIIMKFNMTVNKLWKNKSQAKRKLHHLYYHYFLFPNVSNTIWYTFATFSIILFMLFF